MTECLQKKSKDGQKGQILLMAAMIIIILIISASAVVFVHQISVRHQAASHKQTQGQGIADEGIAYAARALSDFGVWDPALTANPITAANCNSNSVVPGTQFELACANTLTAGTQYPGLQPYQIAITATAYIPGANGQTTAGASVTTYLSKQTVGAVLSNGMRVGAALEMVRTPNLGTGVLTVHWGPIVCLDTTLWTLTNSLDQNTATTPPTIGYPRKFSIGPITGAGAAYPRSPGLNNSPTTTDQKEYWAYASMHYQSLVNKSWYYGPLGQTWGAENEIGLPAPNSANGPFPGGPGGGVVYQWYHGAQDTTQLTGHYYVPTGVIAVFNQNFKVPSGTIIYVDGGGTVEFDQLQLDLGVNGAFIVDTTGGLTLNTVGTGLALTGGPSPLPPPFNIPVTSPQEYPYWPASATTQWPCRNGIGECNPGPGATTCSVAAPTCTSGQNGNNVNFRGFLWVKTGNLVISNSTWVMDGVVLIGDITQPTASTGQLQMNAGSGLTIFYDALVNQNIQVNPG